MKNYGSMAELDACQVSDGDQVQWFYGSRMSDTLQNFVSHSDDRRRLRVNLSDVGLFDVAYRCQNLVNGAYVIYEIECSDCEGIYIYISNSSLFSKIRFVDL